MRFSSLKSQADRQPSLLWPQQSEFECTRSSRAFHARARNPSIINSFRSPDETCPFAASQASTMARYLTSPTSKYHRRPVSMTWPRADFRLVETAWMGISSQYAGIPGWTPSRPKSLCVLYKSTIYIVVPHRSSRSSRSSSSRNVICSIGRVLSRGMNADAPPLVRVTQDACHWTPLPQMASESECVCGCESGQRMVQYIVD
jgi:hypothetical protein